MTRSEILVFIFSHSSDKPEAVADKFMASIDFEIGQELDAEEAFEAMRSILGEINGISVTFDQKIPKGEFDR